MSAAVETYRDEVDVSYSVDFVRDREPMKKRNRYPDYRRTGSGPSRVGGMHCRRHKRWTWGSGRGARLQNMRAFASCVAIALASLAAPAFGVTFDFKTIGNPGNAGNAANANLGAVSSIFQMSSRETLNSQYVEFLNSVDPTGANPNGIYDGNMTSQTTGGINFNSGAPNGSKYTVKPGAPAGSTPGNSYANMPVNWLTWFSAARFVNWVNNGATPASSTETGAYTLSGATSGPIPARNPGATYFLPSVNEWYKAGFHNAAAGTAGTYYTWPTTNNSTPVNTTSIAVMTGTAGVNAANYGGAATPSVSPLGGGSYYQTTSSYGLFDMLGNVTEFTDSQAGSTTPNIMGGNFLITTANIGNWNANAALRTASSSLVSQGNGFRIAAVPEPATIALAGIGITTLAGLEWMKRRKKKQALARSAG